MKKAIVLTILIVMLASFMLAAKSVPAPRTLRGTLLWQRSNVCGVSDYITTHTMDNYYLVGRFTPTRGEYQGCYLSATGRINQVNACKYFLVDQYRIVCPGQ